MSEKRWRLICYDVRDPTRYRALYKIVRGHGKAVQYSIFRCRLDDRAVEELRWRLAQVLAPEDSLLIIDLCPTCAGKVISRNHVDGWEEHPPTFTIVRSQQASADVSHVGEDLAMQVGQTGTENDEHDSSKEPEST